LHVKDVGAGIDFDKLLAMNCKNYQNKLTLYHDLRWLRDVDMYKSFPAKDAFRCPKADMEHHYVEQL